MDVQGRGLRQGYTTGTCAAAASMAAAVLFLKGEEISQALVETPKGVRLSLEITGGQRGEGWAFCQAVKDGGDDPDATHGMRIGARVFGKEPPKGAGGWYVYETEGISLYLRGGVGIGIVTKPGLACEVGKYAINPVPRSMIFSHVERAARQRGFRGTLWIQIEAPEGEERAKKTFNRRLGILGGISILGTTGIVEPMSEAALIETIRLEIRQKILEGRRLLVLAPGNYGTDFVRDALGLNLDGAVKCSNFIGRSLDMAAEEGACGILLAGHAGKLVKLAAGIMNTHSKEADGRMEILAAYGAACGAPTDMAGRILEAITVEEAFGILEEEPGLLEAVTGRVMERMADHLRARAGETLEVQAVMFTCGRGILGRTAGADGLLSRIRQEEQAAGKGQRGLWLPGTP